MKEKKLSYDELLEQHNISLMQSGALNDALKQANYELAKYKALYTLESKKNEDLTIKLSELEGKINQNQPKAAK